MSDSTKPKTPFISSGHMLQKPPLSTRIVRWIDSIYMFFGLYLVTLFALDSYAAADKSQFNIASSRNHPWTKPRWGGSTDRRNNGWFSGGGGGGSGGRPDDDGSGFGARRVHRLNDYQSPVYRTGCCRE
ncbi:conserved hypothetical protein [Talaromyces stipitatus ATCC 10500]|uniref:Uncharacterized protein n=1 Tax=Talaromyces stipitatus (strain ATCC 10500 / CBS 375.48 / QM 6759 / NRRL 1006) TaxID=441959 RepID=B8MMV2_TALSN|nr:uncharacterized protein TSTA_101080 [Talaromyces stipitatus ATCC 10500]EED13868.1 conserved hypothetical protein [Talaromyces stipitatus ATCC 10500]